jgi:hypothetical protein
MTYQLCIEEVLELLKNDKDTLYSCLLVDRLFCKISVKILWRNIWNFKLGSVASSKILSTLISCLPNESEYLLYKKKIIISTPTSKPPLFDYVSFCKSLSIDDISRMVNYYFENQQQQQSEEIKKSKIMNQNKKLVTKEILKMFMGNININLKKLNYNLDDNLTIPNNITLINLPGAKNCLRNLKKLSCTSDLQSKFFDQLSKVCHNIQSLNILYRDTIKDENGLKKLIYSQNCLKNLIIKDFCYNTNWQRIIPSSLKQHYNTITKFHLMGYFIDKPLTFITELVNLQELVLSIDYGEDYNELKYAIFPKLKILHIHYGNTYDSLIMFLENNGKNLEDLECYSCDESLNLTIAKFCLNLKSLYTRIMEVEILKTILNNCKKLEKLKFMCIKHIYLKVSEVFEIIPKFSPEYFHVLHIREYGESEIFPKELESFFMIWKHRVPFRSITFILEGVNKVENENMEVIEKYKKSSIITKFENIIRYKL